MGFHTKIDLVGQRFGRLTVLKDSGQRTKCGHVIWLAKCSCGKFCGRKKVKVISLNLRYGRTRSCGCLHKEQMRIRGKGNIIHREGYRPSRLYSAWMGLKRKCYNPNSYNYKNYGGKGIKVCKEWLDVMGYINFRIWAFNNGYSARIFYLVIARKNLNGNFQPDNCYLKAVSGLKRKWRNE